MKRRPIEVHPGVFAFDLFTPRQCRAFLALVEPEREGAPAPNSMNRYGAVLGGPVLRRWLAELVAEKVQPIATRHFPELGAPLKKHPYGFVVDYEIDKQRRLATHRDTSDVTLNVCLSRSGTGGELVFVGRGTYADPKTRLFTIEHVVGRALVHRGTHLHRARPITSGTRTNLILWCDARAR